MDDDDDGVVSCQENYIKSFHSNINCMKIKWRGRRERKERERKQKLIKWYSKDFEKKNLEHHDWLNNLILNVNKNSNNIAELNFKYIMRQSFENTNSFNVEIFTNFLFRKNFHKIFI